MVDELGCYFLNRNLTEPQNCDYIYRDRVCAFAWDGDIYKTDGWSLGEGHVEFLAVLRNNMKLPEDPHHMPLHFSVYPLPPTHFVFEFEVDRSTFTLPDIFL